MKASDLESILSVSAPALDPQGGRAVVSVTRPSLAADAVVGQLWSVPLDGAGPERLTRGFRDTNPQFAPDGQLLAFLRAAPGKPAQLHVVSAGGGEPVAVTDAALGVSEFAWSADATRLAFVARVPEQGRYGTVEGRDAGAEDPRTFTSLRYRQNGLGYFRDRRSQLFVVDSPDVTAEPHIEPVPDASGEAPASDAPVAPARQLTFDDADYSNPQFTPDGSAIAVLAARHPERDDDLRSNVWTVPVDGGDLTAVLGWPHTLSIAKARFADDGTLFLLAQEVGESGRDFVARNVSLYVVDDGSARVMTDAETVDLGEPGSDIVACADGGVLVQNRTRGTVQLVEVHRGGALRTLTQGESSVTGAASADGVTVVSYTDPYTAGDVAIVSRGIWRQITDFGAALRRVGVVAPREHVIAGRDGYPVHGWSLVPESAERVPVVLMIHGGPFAAYPAAFFDEAQVLVAAGYGVVMCNPRGSAGYGQQHGRAIRQAMGTVDEADVLDFLDGVLAAESRFDADRVGIMGGSYGGYLTAWITTNEHRFAAAIVERGFLDPDAFVGTSDIGDFFGDEYCGTDPELVASQSPQAHVAGVATPTLVLHSEQDYRCPLGQAERYYAALVRNGVDAQLTVFPGENHELSRSGRPRHRVQRFEVILDWWAQYLPTPENNA
ncbi:Dipeptidyl aminopeptidase/acylaminoacyl peptidase [Paramicrobacterium humi]|uniref:Dipeptidyl aminopeptidase/acylaminoacyl peptidase n=1 Tax=Paramicrobacterium humi TaxID=640635 RepID=A0A1H4R5Y6_9MICO|nr:S9 family peptidase [Microbacterium humi]SEC27302.1 Dipeptidyl aminopeptidase/acylaminoacyl peptidase [Microbacterium humi]